MSRPLRFCFLTTFYPPYNFGGDGIAVERFAGALARRGHHVTVVHDVDAFHALGGRTAPGSPEQSAPDGIDVIGLRSGLGALSPLLTQQFGRPVANARRLREIVADGRFDAVTFNNVSLLGGPGVLSYAGNAARIYLAHEHWLVCPMHVLWRHNREICTGRQCIRCTLHYRRPPQWWRFTGLLERQLREVDTFVAMSEFSRDKHHQFGFSRPMEVLPCFLPDAASTSSTPADALPHPRPYFFYAGRLERIKGLDDVIPAFERYPGADLLIAGAGEHAGALEVLAASNPRVRFLGRLAPLELQAYYRHALAVIVPSVGFETFGMTIIEAFAQGTPVLARSIGPFREIMQQSGAGELFSSADELVAAMARLQNDAPRRQRLGEAGRAAVRSRWSEGIVIPQYLDIVRHAMARRAATAHALASTV